MVQKISFQSLQNCDLVKQDVLDVIKFIRGTDSGILKKKKWIYATIDDKQMLDDDASNLAFSLGEIDCVSAYYGWSIKFEEGGNFDVYNFPTDRESIVGIQAPDSPLDHMDSIIFGNYPLRFCIFRPATFDKLLYVMGEEGFVKRCCEAPGWNMFV